MRSAAKRALARCSRATTGPSRGSTVTPRQGLWTSPTCSSPPLSTGPSNCGAPRYVGKKTVRSFCPCVASRFLAVCCLVEGNAHFMCSISNLEHCISRRIRRLSCREPSSVTDLNVLFARLQNNKPLYSFEDSSDYVYDVMWSPTHPALFACVDGVGHLDLWNLNNDTEVSHHMLLSVRHSSALPK